MSKELYVSRDINNFNDQMYIVWQGQPTWCLNELVYSSAHSGANIHFL